MFVCIIKMYFFFFFPFSPPQDSMLDFDGQSLDPAIVSAHPMKPASMEMPPMVCQPGMFLFAPHDPTACILGGCCFFCNFIYFCLSISNQLKLVGLLISKLAAHPETHLAQPQAVGLQPEPTQVSIAKFCKMLQNEFS